MVVYVYENCGLYPVWALVGVGLRLRPQLLPPVPGCVLCAAATQEEPLRRNGSKPGQAELLHPLLLCTKSCFFFSH